MATGPRGPSSAGDQRHALIMRLHPSVWAQEKRCTRDKSTGELVPWSFAGREWQRDLLDDLSDRVVIEKAAQMGLTECAMIRAMHGVDVLASPALYLFPTERDSSDFSAARFDAMLQMSPSLADIFTDVANVGLKRAGETALYFRGSNSHTSVKSIPVAMLLIDEFEEMDAKGVALARERLSGHRDTCEWNLSTPKFPGKGIDEEFGRTDQRHWFVPCPRCAVMQRLLWPGSVKFTEGAHPEWSGATFQCQVCAAPWTDAERVAAIDRGEWRALAPDNAPRGYHINQLYSVAMTAERIAKKWTEAETSSTRMEEFHNSVLGLPYQAASLKVTESILEDCKGREDMVSSARGGAPVAMGVDVGRVSYYWCAEWRHGRPYYLAIGTVDSFDELELTFDRFGVSVCVIDAQPERHKVSEFRDAHLGAVYLAFYPRTEYMSGQEVVLREDQDSVNIHRTALIDRVVGRFMRREPVIPRDTPAAVARHFGNINRQVETHPRTGETRASWINSGPDHHVHAAVYCDVALELIGVPYGGEEAPDDGGGGGGEWEGAESAWGDEGEVWGGEEF